MLDSLPDALLAWVDTIVDGAQARLLGMRGTNHYDPQEAANANRRFYLGVAQQNVESRVGPTMAGLRVKQRPFA